MSVIERGAVRSLSFVMRCGLGSFCAPIFTNLATSIWSRRFSLGLVLTVTSL